MVCENLRTPCEISCLQLTHKHTRTTTRCTREDGLRQVGLSGVLAEFRLDSVDEGVLFWALDE